MDRTVSASGTQPPPPRRARRTGLMHTSRDKAAAFTRTASMRISSTGSANLFALLMLVPMLALSQPSTRDEAATVHSDRSHATRTRFIVQSSSAPAADASVVLVGGTVRRQLAIINAVEADLSAEEASALGTNSGLRLFKDRSLAPLDAKVPAPRAPPAPPAPPALPGVKTSQVLTDGTAINT